MLLVVEHGQCLQGGGQVLPRDQHCRRGRGSGAGSTSSSHSQGPLRSVLGIHCLCWGPGLGRSVGGEQGWPR